MKKFCLILSLLLVALGCDQGKKMVAPVMDDVHVPVKETTTPTVPVEDVIEEITFDNVSSLQFKRYRMRPTEFAAGIGAEGRIEELVFGSVSPILYDGVVKLNSGLAADTPKVAAYFQLTSAPYAETTDGLPVIDWTLKDDGMYVSDEIVIEIQAVGIQSERTSTGGRGGEPFTYVFMQYDAIAIENLTNPDRKFEYE